MLFSVFSLLALNLHGFAQNTAAQPVKKTNTSSQETNNSKVALWENQPVQTAKNKPAGKPDKGATQTAKPAEAQPTKAK